MSELLLTHFVALDKRTSNLMALKTTPMQTTPTTSYSTNYIDSCASSLPDHIWLKVILLCNTAADRMRVGSVCRRLRLLVVTQRRVWRRFHRVHVVCDRDVLISCGDGQSIVHFSLSNQRKATSAFIWLFTICRPKLLRLSINNHAGYYRLINRFVDALPENINSPSSVERLELYSDFLSPEFDAFERLLERLPITITHLRMSFDFSNTKFDPILAKWLENCCNLEVLLCHISCQNDVSPSLMVDALASLPALKSVSFKKDVINRNVQSSISHICCWDWDSGWRFSDCCQQLSERAQSNIRSLCCINPRELQHQRNIRPLPRLFPNCHEMQFIGDVSAMCLDELCSVYRELDEARHLTVTLHVWNLHTPTVRQSHAVEIRRLPYDFNNCCPIKHLFGNASNI